MRNSGVKKGMTKPKLGSGVIIGKNVKIGENVTIWNFVVIGDNAHIGDGTLVGSFCDIGKEVIIGRNCNIQAHVTISNGCKIGDNVFIAPNTSLLNDRYPKSDLLTPPIVGDYVIIGGGVTVLPGVVIGRKSVVAGGSVVTKDVAPNTVVKGVPAKAAMTLREYERKREKYINSRR
jgi:UDP-2-acetamido-3-amino-2,3-dideoxy-glucuronate N-acetyltransferase